MDARRCWSGTSRSAAATERVGRALGEALWPPPRGGGVVALLGDLGAGKTVMASGIAHGFGVPASVPVTSPTFTVAKSYRGRARFDHLDAYHVRSAAELEAAGFEDLGGEGRVLCVEWGDRIAGSLPADRLEVTITPAAAPAPPGAVRNDRLDAAEPPRRIDVHVLGPRSAAVLDRARPALDAAVAAADGALA